MTRRAEPVGRGAAGGCANIAISPPSTVSENTESGTPAQLRCPIPQCSLPPCRELPGVGPPAMTIGHVQRKAAMGPEGVVRHRATTNRTLGDHIADGSRSVAREIGFCFGGSVQILWTSCTLDAKLTSPPNSSIWTVTTNGNCAWHAANGSRTFQS
jgi:hypothetical protein